MKTNEEINKYFTELFGKCWHIQGKFSLDTPYGKYSCIKCDYYFENPDDVTKNPDYFSKEGFWDLWKFLKQKRIYWRMDELILANTRDFSENGCVNCSEPIIETDVDKIIDFINYETFARDVYEFLFVKEKK